MSSTPSSRASSSSFLGRFNPLGRLSSAANPSDYQPFESPNRASQRDLDDSSMSSSRSEASIRLPMPNGAAGGGGDVDRSFFVKDLDEFLKDAYFYFEGKGFWPIIASTAMSELTSAFLIMLFGFLTTFLNYGVLFEQNDLGAAISSPVLNAGGLVFFILFWLIWAGEVLFTAARLRKLRKVRRFYLHNLNISAEELLTIEWSAVSRRILTVPRLCLAKPEWTELDISNRLMRKDNYLIALINRNVLDLSVPFLPRRMTILTTPIYWAIRASLFPFFFDDNGVKQDILHARDDPALLDRLSADLARRLKLFGAVALLMSPFVFVYLAAYTFFDYGRELRTSPRDISTRIWSLLAQWKFREFNELPHSWQKRLRRATSPAFDYVNQFHNVYLTAVARFFAFAGGSLLIVFVILGFIDDGLLQTDILGPFSGIWIIGVLGLVTAAALAFVPKEDYVFDPKLHLQRVREHTHYMPNHWRNREHLPSVAAEFRHLFEYRAVFYLKEVSTILLVPFTILISLPRSARRIVTFFASFTANSPGVGHVVVWASFDLCHFGNPRYGAPLQSAQSPVISSSSSSSSSSSLLGETSDTPQQQHPQYINKEMLTRHGKMEKSFLSFKANHPGWLPDQDGQQYLANLRSHLVETSDPISLASSVTPHVFRHGLSHSFDRSTLRASGGIDPLLSSVLSPTREAAPSSEGVPATMTWPAPESLENSARIHYDLTCSLSTLQDHYYNSGRRR